MITRQEQLLSGETLTAANLPSNIYLSKVISFGWEGAWALVLRCTGGASATGTTPSMTPELDLSKDGGAFTSVGGAITAVTPTTLAVNNTFVYVYAPGSGTAQGPITTDTPPLSTHDYKLRVKIAFANADNVFPGVFLDLIALN